MKRFTILSLGVLLGFALAAGAYAVQEKTDAGGAAGQPPAAGKKAESPSQPAPGPIISPQTAGHTETVEGELLRIDGDTYVVKDATGKEVNLKVDKDTKLEGNIAAHDQIVARATAMKSQHAEAGKWHADSIKKK
jgi:uncharacterized protein YdeI (BOF family)